MNDSTTNSISVGCPVITATNQRITLAQGEGGRLMRRLVRERILAVLGTASTNRLGDSALLPTIEGPIAMTTDSFIVSPLFFPGGDIGTLAVNGTVNDLAVAGAKPLYLSLSLIIEEGFELEQLDRILTSIATTAREASVQIVTGDTKVAPRGAVDGMFINTTGIGRLQENSLPGASTLEPGDELLVTGPIGQHGIAILVARNELAFDPAPTSDCASLAAPAEALLRSTAKVRTMRDATRGGVGAVLHEWAEEGGQTLAIDEKRLPVSAEVRGACEVLGLDPIHAANEGTMVIAVRQGDTKLAIEALKAFPATSKTVCFGEVRRRDVVPVVITRALGTETPLDEPLGAPMPRIC